MSAQDEGFFTLLIHYYKFSSYLNNTSANNAHGLKDLLTKHLSAMITAYFNAHCS